MPARQGLELFGEQLSRLLQSVFVHVYLSLLSLCHLSWFLLSLRFGLHLSAPNSVISPGRSDLVLERRQSYQVFGVYMCVCVVGVGGRAEIASYCNKTWHIFTHSRRTERHRYKGSDDREKWTETPNFMEAFGGVL